MSRTLLLLAVAASMTLAQADQAFCGEGGARLTEPALRQATRLLDTWIESVIDYERLPGLSLAVVHDQEIVYTKGYGYQDVDRRVEATPGTIYSICSITKMFTALAVMQLRDAGKLDLDDSVSRHLPWFAPEGETAERPVTLRQLLRHTGGLPCEADHTVWDDPEQLDPAWEEFIARVKRLKLNGPVGATHNYSNVGYALLGEVIAKVSGQSYEDYVQEHLLNPLGMKDTILFPPEQRIAGRLATGYSDQPRRQGPRASVTDREPRAFVAAGGYYSTVLDMARFAMWQLRILDGRDERILSRQTLEEMQTVQWENPKWGLGFTLYWLGDLDLYGHQGGCSSGFKAQFILCPEEKLAVVVMINAVDAPQFELAFYTYMMMSPSLQVGGGEPAEPGRWSQYAGFYTADRTWSDAEVLEWEGSLAVLWVPTQNPLNSLVRLRHVKDGVFRQVDDEGKLSKHYVFKTDTAGNVRLRFNNNILCKADR